MFGDESYPPSPPPQEETYIHTWDEYDKELIDVFGSENRFNINDYYVNSDVFEQDQFLGTLEEFGFDMDI